MKEMLFTKDESKFIRDCLQNEIDSLKMGFFGQDMELTKQRAKKEKECQRLIKKFENAEKKIKVSSAKGKGRGFQYWVCERIAKMFGLEFIQSDDDCLIQSRPMGQHSVDIILRGELKKKFPFSIECKCQENLSLPEWIRQARENTLPNTYWLLVFKKQTIGHEPLVVMEWDTFEKIFLSGRKEKDY
jgi:hypothetical protein